MENTFLILGGYGNTGYLIAKYLLKENDVKIILAGRNLNKARNAADRLNAEMNCEKVSAEFADASDYYSLVSVFQKSSFVINASSTMEFAGTVARACIDTNNNYLDTQLSSGEKINTLRSFEKEIDEKNLLFITDGGYHPGMVSALVRYAAPKFEKLYKANVYAYMNIDWRKYNFSEATLNEFIGEIKNYNYTVYKNAKWVKADFSRIPKYNFGEEIGEEQCAAMFMEELKELPDLFPSLNETGFYIGGMDWFTNYITFPLGMILFKMAPRFATKFMGRIFEFGVNNFCKPPFLVMLEVDAEGIIENKTVKHKVTISHSDGYELTAAPVAACLHQYLRKSLPSSGLFLQANIVEPISFFNFIKNTGIKLSET
ncbi:MAG: saccharopine dehydrogenase NADP-binding domain-containing protein [Bacteroidetes bacterium]|nr:saccharopine dehydrogenase NADP-binding domain-containing protein [Bacteroidota bacterium]